MEIGRTATRCATLGAALSAITLLTPSAHADDYGDYVTSLNPVSYWRLNETSGTAAGDTMSMQSGTYTNGPLLNQSGAIGTDVCADFDGSDDYVNVPHHADYLINDGAVQAWIKPDSITSRRMFFSKDSNGYDTGGHLTMYVESSNVKVRLQSASTSYIIESAITAGAWHHVLFTFGSGGMKLYLNGTLVDSFSYTGGMGSNSGGTGNTEPLAIGANTWSSGDGTITPIQEHFNGGIDEVAIFNTPLTATQISELANTPPTLFTDVSSTLGFNVATTSEYHHGSGWNWGDLDNDGDLDAIATGGGNARLFKNTNEGQAFITSSFGSGNVRRQGGLADYDNDGDLDFFTGCRSGYDTEALYENDGTATFSDIGSAGMGAVSNSEGVAATDLNQDGWCDIVLFSGTNNWIGHNDTSTPANFTATTDVLYGLNDSGDYGNGDFCSSGDVNNDGHLDFFWHYGDGKLFLSDGDGTFSHDNRGISVVTGNSDKIGSAWGDFDNDGDIDLFVPRYDSGQAGYLWRNDGASFTDVTVAAGIADTSVQRSAAWGDYDNDGYLDLYIVNYGSANVMYQNQGDGTFTPATVGAEDAGSGHDGVFVDMDNDGDLDISLSNEDGTAVLLSNSTNNSSYLKVRVVGVGDGGTNAAGVGVRVDLYDSTGLNFIARREIGVARGYGGSEPNWVHFGGVNPALDYIVRVHFASGQVDIDVTPLNVSTTIASTTINQMLTVDEGESLAVFTDVSSTLGFSALTSAHYHYGSGWHWGDVDNDGDLDAIVTGDTARFYRNTNEGQSFFLSSFGTGVVLRGGGFADFDNDGDLDFMTGANNGYYDPAFYENDGGGVYSSNGYSGMASAWGAEGVATIDLNTDGFADLVLFGDDNWIGINQSDSPPTFAASNDASYGFSAASSYSDGDYISMGDVNNDGELDVFWHASNGRLFLSDGDGTYTDTSVGISVVTGNDDKIGSEWGDYDNDGDLDLFVPRYDAGAPGYLWRNNGSTFTNVASTAGITSTASQRSATWGDHDNDGDLDLYIVTYDGDNVLYDNQGDGTFIAIAVNAEANGTGLDGVFVDYDNDGDLDISVSNEGENAILLRNETNSDTYLKVRLIGLGSSSTPAAASGIRVDIYDAAGTTFIARREGGLSRGYGGSTPHWLHFGGLEPGTYYTVKVHFQNGIKQLSLRPRDVTTTIGGTTIQQMVTITEDQDRRIVRWQEVAPE